MATAAARFMQVPVKQMFSDPTTLAESLQSCQKLFKYDGIAILLDTTLEAEACGCQLSWEEGEPPKVVSHIWADGKDPESLDVSAIERQGRIPVVLEVAKRLTQTMGREVAMLGVITGPLTLSRHLMGEAFNYLADNDSHAFMKMMDLSGKIASKLTKAFGELNFDAVILADERFSSLYPVHYPKIQPTLKTLRNLAKFYDIPLIILTRRVPPVPDDRFSAFLQFKADGFSLSNPISDLEIQSLPGGMLLGRCIPKSILLGSAEGIEKYVSELLDKSNNSRFFVASDWEIPPATPALNIHKVMQVLTGASAK
jgi:uroporphyrinogen-III decarboxylase